MSIVSLNKTLLAVRTTNLRRVLYRVSSNASYTNWLNNNHQKLVSSNCSSTSSSSSSFYIHKQLSRSFSLTSANDLRLKSILRHFNHTQTRMSAEKVEFKRLPLTVLPVNYAVTLQPNFTDFTFDGQVAIDVNVKESVDHVLLNSVELTFDKATFENADGSKVESTSVEFSEATEVATLRFPSALKTGQGKVHIKYTGKLNENLKGFYRSKYKHPSGETRYAAVTQFEAADARRALPCWDEPAHKATFDVSIIADSSKTVLSNMPLVSTHDVEGNAQLKKSVFDRTPKMSTYLLAFVVGEYDYIEAKDRDGVLIRVYTPLGKKHFGQFALDVSLKTLPFYTDYFKIGYPLPKLDLIAIADFAAGAMENWGLVTYRETALLIDPDNSSLQSKQTVAIVVGHEIAHQWFGNIVTMEWWTHLWLNEGFASWIEYLCVDHCLPEFDIWTHFVTSDYCRALELDGLKNSHPIEVEVRSPAEVDEIFDAISYSKGASTIRMLHDYIGDDAFRLGLHNYLEKFKYSNTFTEDLWEKLSEASNKPVNDLMQLWTKQTGYPVITVSERIDDNKHTILTLSQERFFSNGDKPTAEENTMWKVPISIMTKSSFPKVKQQVLLEKRTDEIDLGVLDESDWIKLNLNSIGFYRTNYSKTMLNRIVQLVKDKTLHPTDRLGLQNDAFALAQAGFIPTANVLEFVQAYANEDNVTVWRDLLSNLVHLSGLLQNTDFHDHFASYIRKLVKPIATKLGWDVIPGESSLQAMCRALVLRVLAVYGDEEVQAEAKKRFESGAHVSADLRSAVYAGVIVNADEALIQKIIEMHDASDLQEEKMRLATSLGVVRDENLIRKVLNFAISPSVRSQDSVSVICAVAGSVSNAKAGDITWTFVKDNWGTLYSRYCQGFLITRLVKLTTEGFASQEKYTEVEEFFKKNPAPGAARTIQQSLESIRTHTAWLSRDRESVKALLSKY